MISDKNHPGSLQLFREKLLTVAFDFGWRSAGVPGTPGFGVLGWSGLPLR